MSPVLLTAAQRQQFDNDGFLVLRDAIPPELVARLTSVADRLFEAGVAKEGLSERLHWQMRNCLPADPVFRELLDYPTILPIVAGLLDWDIHLNTSHLIIRPPSPPNTNEHFKGEGWHRDGGQSSRQMSEPHPRLFLKVAYFLSDQSETGRGNTMVVPGSNRLIGPPAQAPGAPHPYGAIEITGKPGDAFLFEQRCWHAVGPNYSNITRKSLFMGYGFRWVRAMDYFAPYTDLFPGANPIQRQLMGEIVTPMGLYIPTEADVPLRAQWQKWYGK